MDTETIETPENEVTGTTAESQVKGFTQEEVNKIVADRVERERKKYSKQYEGVDLDHYRELTEAEEARKVKRQKERGEFETILKEQATKFQTENDALRNELKSIKVDGALLNTVASLKAVNPEQVVQLLKGQVRLGEAGDVEVIDANGQVRYTDSGDPMSLNDLGTEFLNQYPHFVQATPRGAGTTSNVGTAHSGKIDLAKLVEEMNTPEGREKYKEAKAKGLL